MFDCTCLLKKHREIFLNSYAFLQRFYHLNSLGKYYFLEFYESHLEVVCHICCYMTIASSYMGVHDCHHRKICYTFFLEIASASQCSNIASNIILPLFPFSSVVWSCPALCDPMNCSTPGIPIHHQLWEFTQTHVHRVSDSIQPSHPLSSPLLLLLPVPPSIRVFFQ